jgi:anti-sigma B factor antagonist
MPIQCETLDETLVIRILDERLREESQIKRLYDDVLEQLEKSTQTQVILDFAAVQFMSSSMLGKLVQIHKKCQEFKVKLKLSAISTEIFEVFKITKMNKLFDFQPDVAAARKSFNKRGFFG